jgi:hypothetical protein
VFKIQVMPRAALFLAELNSRKDPSHLRENRGDTA